MDFPFSCLTLFLSFPLSSLSVWLPCLALIYSSVARAMNTYLSITWYDIIGRKGERIKCSKDWEEEMRKNWSEFNKWDCPRNLQMYFYNTVIKGFLIVANMKKTITNMERRMFLIRWKKKGEIDKWSAHATSSNFRLFASHIRWFNYEPQQQITVERLKKMDKLKSTLKKRKINVHYASKWTFYTQQQQQQSPQHCVVIYRIGASCR